MKKCKHKIFKIITMIIVICVWLSSVAFSSEKKDIINLTDDFSRHSVSLGIRTLKVGWPIQGNLMNVDKNGNPCGYTYEYLMRIKQYTGWDYEFVIVDNEFESLMGLIKKLNTGEIDLLGGMNYAPSPNDYDIATDPYCMSYTTLASYKNNDEIFSIADLMRKDKIKLALRTDKYGSLNTITNKKAQEFCELNKIKYDIVVCSNEEEQKENLISGLADVFPVVDFMIEDNFRIVAKFNYKSVHFVTTPTDANILLELNSALFEIESSTPQFRNDLYKDFFESTNKQIYLTKEEKAYIDNGEIISVIINPNVAPFQYKVKGALKGITFDLMEKIKEKTGLKFNYILKNGADYKNTVQSGGNFIIGSIAYEYKTAEILNVLLTSPYVSTPMLLIANNDSKNKEPKDSIVGVVEGTVVEDLIGYKQVKLFKDIKECIDAAEKGEVDFAYGNSISMSFYGFQSNYKNLIAIPIINQNKDYCIALSKNADAELFGIINKALRSLDKNEISSIITGNTENYQKNITIKYLLTNYPLEALGILLTISLVGIAIIVLFFIMKIKSNRQLLINAKRYEELSEISGEFLIEYNVKNDILTLTHSCAELLGIPQKNINASKNNVLKPLQQIISFKSGEYDIQLPTLNKEQNWFKVVSSVVRDNYGKPVSLICKLSDIQTDMSEKEKLLEKSVKDDLTNLYKIGYFKKYVIDKITQIDRKSGTFFIFDLDGFKNINDTYGHLSGDKVLKEVADKLQNVLGESHCLARLGGDEFVAYAENMDIEEVRRTVDNALKSIEHLNYKEISISCGVCYTVKSTDYDEIYSTADKALYKVKENGGNNYKIYYDDGFKRY